MPRLISRQKQIPNGFRFSQPEIRWMPKPFASFDVVVATLIAARAANPALVKQFGWSLDYETVANQVDESNAAHCIRNGWTNYVIGGDQGGAPAPFPFPRNRPAPPTLSQKLSNVAAGSEVIVEWIKSGAEAVPQEQANARAEVCAVCRLNGKGGWESYFTVPASNAIRAALRNRSEFGLSTPHDDKLGVCEACSCPMALKVFLPLDKFFGSMTQQAKDGLHPQCWILAEVKELQKIT
jgi:hypothetical protein